MTGTVSANCTQLPTSYNSIGDVVYYIVMCSVPLEHVCVESKIDRRESMPRDPLHNSEITPLVTGTRIRCVMDTHLYTLGAVSMGTMCIASVSFVAVLSDRSANEIFIAIWV